MDSLVSGLTSIFFVAIVWSFFQMLITMVRGGKIRIEHRKEIKSRFPELSKKEIREREIEIVSYERRHMMSRAKTTTQEVSVVIVIAAMSAMIFADKGSLLFLGVSFTFAGILFLCAPTQKDRKEFWEEYVKENPNNTWKPLVIENPKFDKNVRKGSIYFIVFGFGWVILQILRWVS